MQSSLISAIQQSAHIFLPSRNLSWQSPQLRFSRHQDLSEHHQQLNVQFHPTDSVPCTNTNPPPPELKQVYDVEEQICTKFCLKKRFYGD